MVDSEIGVAADQKFRVQYLAFLDETIHWFAVRARRNQWLYSGSRVALVILSASLPVLIANHQTPISTPIAVLVAILAGLEAQFKPGDQWKHQRSAELTLKTYKRDYEHNLARGHTDAKPGDEIGKDPFELLYRTVGSFLEAEPKEFWQSRLTGWPQRSS